MSAGPLSRLNACRRLAKRFGVLVVPFDDSFPHLDARRLFRFTQQLSTQRRSKPCRLQGAPNVELLHRGMQPHALTAELRSVNAQRCLCQESRVSPRLRNMMKSYTDTLWRKRERYRFQGRPQIYKWQSQNSKRPYADSRIPARYLGKA